MISKDLRGARAVFLVAIAVGLMLSRESLVILGNSAGHVGMWFLAVLSVAIVIHVFTALSYGELLSRSPGQEQEARFLEEALGSVPAIVLPVCSRVVFTICAATGLLAAAGYVFNEVFVHWFPNLGFSFCLLAFLLVINLLGPGVSARAQIIFAAAALAGLVFLSLAGLFGLERAAEVVKVPPHLPVSVARVVFLGLLVFIGFDLAALAEGGSEGPSGSHVRAMVMGIILVGVVFGLWGLVSIGYVPLERLAEATVPYSVAARAIMGQKGRVVMGVVLLAGTCSAVNALLLAVSRMMVGMAARGLLPPFLGWARERAPVPLLLLALGTAAMMAHGMAGEPELEVYTMGGILFWLLNYVAVHLSVLITRRRATEASVLFRMPGYPAVTAVALVFLLTGFVGLLWSDSASAHLLRFMLVIAAVAAGLAYLWTVASNRKRRLVASEVRDR